MRPRIHSGGVSGVRQETASPFALLRLSISLSDLVKSIAHRQKNLDATLPKNRRHPGKQFCTRGHVETARIGTSHAELFAVKTAQVESHFAIGRRGEHTDPSSGCRGFNAFREQVAGRIKDDVGPAAKFFPKRPGTESPSTCSSSGGPKWRTKAAFKGPSAEAAPGELADLQNRWRITDCATLPGNKGRPRFDGTSSGAMVSADGSGTLVLETRESAKKKRGKFAPAAPSLEKCSSLRR